MNISSVVLDLPTSVELTEGTYWLMPVVTNVDEESLAAFWEVTSTGVTGKPMYRSIDDGQIWAADFYGMNGVFFVAGECVTLGTSETKNDNFTYYPNPVGDELFINSKKKIQRVEVYNLAGQKIKEKQLNVTNGVIDTRSLTPGTYLFKALVDGGSVETFKVTKK
jgi:hypothetical protein